MVSSFTFYFRGQIWATFFISIILFISFIYFHAIDRLKLNSSTSHSKSFEQSHAGQPSNLQWCKANPFLRKYDQQVVNNFEKKWYIWNQNQFSHTFDYLKTYAQSSGNALEGFVKVVYPAEPLPCPYNNNTMKRYGHWRDSGKILCGLEALSPEDICVVYSLGSGNDFEFERSVLSNSRCTVYTFDCTSSPPIQKIKRLHFHKICLGENSPMQNYLFPWATANKSAINRPPDTVYMKFNQILKMLNHTMVHVLKMDIEGGEYSVFADLLTYTNRANLPYQVSLESHWWHRDIYHAILHMSLFSQLWKSGYRLLQHEFNANDPACIEWTFMRVYC
jgi:hypothetical protein